MSSPHLILEISKKPMSENPLTVGGMRRKPRQARSQERVNRILDGAEGLFASQGYTATTTNDGRRLFHA